MLFAARRVLAEAPTKWLVGTSIASPALRQTLFRVWMRNRPDLAEIRLAVRELV